MRNHECYEKGRHAFRYDPYSYNTRETLREARHSGDECKVSFADGYRAEERREEDERLEREEEERMEEHRRQTETRVQRQQEEDWELEQEQERRAEEEAENGYGEL